MKKYLKNKIPKNKQEFDYFYEINGSIYISKSNRYLKEKSFLSNKTLAFNMDKQCSKVSEILCTGDLLTFCPLLEATGGWVYTASML